MKNLSSVSRTSAAPKMLRQMKDQDLVLKTDVLVQKERELLTEVLHCLKEIEARRLYSSYGFKSLFEMAKARWNYSEDQISRRLSAMRLLKEIPELEEKIESGELTMTHLGLAQAHFNREKQAGAPLPLEHKKEVLHQMVGTSTREAQRVVVSQCSSPQVASPDRVKVFTESTVELKFVASRELMQKIEALKGLIAHKSSQVGLGELFEKLCDLGLKEWNRFEKSNREEKSKETTNTRAHGRIPKRSTGISSLLSKSQDMPTASEIRKALDLGNNLTQQQKQKLEQHRESSSGLATEKCAGRAVNLNKTEERQETLKTSREPERNKHKQKTLNSKRQRSYIPIQIKRQVYQEAQGKCQICGSKYALEIDHTVPISLGGGHHASNLRLLCRSCNQRSAIQMLGFTKMQKYL